MLSVDIEIFLLDLQAGLPGGENALEPNFPGNWVQLDPNTKIREFTLLHKILDPGQNSWTQDLILVPVLKNLGPVDPNLVTLLAGLPVA